MSPDHRGHYDFANAAISALFEVFGITTPPNLGTEILRKIVDRLRRERLCATLADDILHEVLVAAYRGLSRMRPRHPRAWLHEIRRNVTTTFLINHAKQTHEALSEVLLAQTLAPLADVDENVTQDLLEQAMKTLRPRHAELILLDLGERLSPEEIRDRMKIRSEGYFRKLKSEAFGALREALKVVASQWIGSAMS